MDIKIKDKHDIIPIRKKRESFNDYKSFFQIYKSQKTLSDYMFYLKKFLNFVYEGDSEIKGNELLSLMNNVNEDDVEKYIVYLVEVKKLKKTSINKIISSLKSLYNDLESKGFNNPLKSIKLFKVSRDLDSILKLSYEDIKRIVDLTDVNNYLAYRNITILFFLFYTGMRSQELLNLKFSDIINRNGIYYIKLSKTKSQKIQFKPMHDKLVTKYNDYRAYIMNLLLIKSSDSIDDLFVFSSSNSANKQLSYRSLYDIIKNMGKLINKDISPHNIRHAVATELSLNGADLLEIRDFLGHSDTKVTEVYINAKNLIIKNTLNKIPDIEQTHNDNIEKKSK